MSPVRSILSVVLLVGAAGMVSAGQPPLELVVQRGPKISSAVVSGDGRLVFTAGKNTVTLWDATSGKLLRTFGGPKVPFSSESNAVSADGKLIATGGPNFNTASLWDTTTGQQVHEFPGHSGAVIVALSANGKFLATGSNQPEVFLWDAATGKKIQTIKGSSSRFNEVRKLAVSDDGKMLVVVRTLSKMIEVWDVATGMRNLKVLAEHKLDIHCVAMSADGKRIVTGSSDNTACLWDAASGKKLQTFTTIPGSAPLIAATAETKYIAGVAMSPDGLHILTGSSDGTVILWLASNGRRVQTFKDPSGTNHGVGLSHDGKIALSVPWKGPSRLWDTATGKMIQSFGGYNAPITSLAVSGDGKTLVTGTNEGVASVWNLAGGKQSHILGGPWTKFVAIDENGTKAALSENGGVAVWDPASGKKLRSYDNYPDKHISVAISGDGRRVAAGSRQAAVLWQIPAANALRAFEKVHVAEVTCVDLNRDGTMLATGSLDGNTVIWNAATGKKLHLLKAAPNGGLIPPVFAVAMSADGSRVVTGQFDKTAVLWDTTTGKPLHQFQNHTAEVKNVAISADGKLVATGSGMAAHLWNAESGKLIQNFDLGNLIRNDLFKPGSKERDRVLQEYGVGLISGLDLTSDGKWVWTAASDFVGARLWDAATGKERCRLFSFDAGQEWLVVTPEGLFDASPGAWRYVAYRAQGKAELIDDDATRRQFHRPGLLANITTGKP